MITGLATGMQSVAIPVFTIVCIIFTANYFAGLYGVGIAANWYVEYGWNNKWQLMLMDQLLTMLVVLQK